MGPVGGADLYEPRSGRGHDVGDPELAPDLDELAAAYDDLPARAQCGEDEQDGGRVVVDHQRRLGPRQGRERTTAVLVAPAPFPRTEIELEVGVAAADLVDRSHLRV